MFYGVPQGSILGPIYILTFGDIICKYFFKFHCYAIDNISIFSQTGQPVKYNNLPQVTRWEKKILDFLYTYNFL